MNFKEFKGTYERVPVDHYPTRVSDDPLVSVCVQTYQHEAYIEECLNGVLMQKTDFDFEIILGEDASSDKTREICIEYADKYPEKFRLHLHHRENNIKVAGHATGRFNFLYNIFSARGKYLAVCEGDDYWSNPDKLQLQIDFLKNNPQYSLLYHKANVITEWDEIKPSLKRQQRTGYDFNLADSLENKNGATAGLIFRNRKEIPELLALCASSTAAGDWPLEVICMLYGIGRFEAIDTVVYRQHAGGSTENVLKGFNRYGGREIFLRNLLNSGYDIEQSQIELISAFWRCYKVMSDKQEYDSNTSFRQWLNLASLSLKGFRPSKNFTLPDHLRWHRMLYSIFRAYLSKSFSTKKQNTTGT